MAIVQTSIFLIMERFPAYKDTILRLLKDNEPFKIVSEDYRRCAQALKHWEQSKTREAPERVNEYKELLKNLEEEILGHLKRVN